MHCHRAFWSCTQLEDDEDTDDVPDDAASRAAGYRRPNAYYVGNNGLNVLDLSGSVVELCFGVKSGCQISCELLTADMAGIHVTSDKIVWPGATPADNLKKMIAAFTGQSSVPQSTDEFFVCGAASSFPQCPVWGSMPGTWGGTWSNCPSDPVTSYTRGISAHTNTNSMDAAWHMWGCGITLWNSNSLAPVNKELSMWTKSQAGPNVMQIRYGSLANALAARRGNSATSCTNADGFEYIFVLEDDVDANDLPDDRGAIAAGFSNANAYYIGNTYLNALDLSGSVVELCFGVKSGCQISCELLTADMAGLQITDNKVVWPGATPADNLKKVIAGLTGQSAAPQEGSSWLVCGDPSTFSQCPAWVSVQGTWGGTWSNCGGPASSYTRGISAHTNTNSMDAAWHMWGCGITLWNSNSVAPVNKELSMWTKSQAGPNVMQIRYKKA